MDGKSRRYGMARAHIMVFISQKPSTKGGIIRPAILFLAWFCQRRRDIEDYNLYYYPAHKRTVQWILNLLIVFLCSLLAVGISLGVVFS